MLDLQCYGCTWPDDLMPLGFDEFGKENFQSWWDRHETRLAHLHPSIAEQWIYRHWHHSPYSCLPLQGLRWRQENWLTQRILRDVFIADWHLDADHDYEVFNPVGGHPTSRAMNLTGTWDYPIVAIETPNGFRLRHGDYPEERFLLVEGHSRYRYLNALAARGTPASEHSVFVIHY